MWCSWVCSRQSARTVHVSRPAILPTKRVRRCKMDRSVGAHDHGHEGKRALTTLTVSSIKHVTSPLAISRPAAVATVPSRLFGSPGCMMMYTSWSRPAAAGEGRSPVSLIAQ